MLVGACRGEDILGEVGRNGCENRRNRDCRDVVTIV